MFKPSSPWADIDLIAKMEEGDCIFFSEEQIENMGQVMVSDLKYLVEKMGIVVDIMTETRQVILRRPLPEDAPRYLTPKVMWNT